MKLLQCGRGSIQTVSPQDPGISCHFESVYAKEVGMGFKKDLISVSQTVNTCPAKAG